MSTAEYDEDMEQLAECIVRLVQHVLPGIDAGTSYEIVLQELVNGEGILYPENMEGLMEMILDTGATIQ